MRDKVFVDTNIFIYAYSDDDILKHQKARKLFQKDLANSSITVSVQVLNEFYSVMSKSKLSHQKITQQINEIVRANFCKSDFYENNFAVFESQRKI